VTQDVFPTFAAELQALPAAEIVAVAAAIGYLVLAIRQNIWCWPCACVSTGIYVALFIDARLYMESILNVFYLGMAVYGWQHWLRGSRGPDRLPVIRWPARIHLAACAVLVLLAALNGWLLERYSNAAYPYVDSLITWSAIWATYLVAQKVLENWWYWLAIDGVSMVLYWLRDLELTAALFLLYVLLIPIGFISWRRSMTSPAV
jgi:nicotinamide mononucleotide transporter